jgi:hypothetical protein
MAREPDLSFEALATATGTDWTAGRGELNSALASIRGQWTGEEDELPAEIAERAKLYRRVFQGAALTPTALAKHWLRVFEEMHRASEQATNVSRPYENCVTCGGHHFVVYSTRPMPETYWMREHGHKSNGLIEEYAPCPECGPPITPYRRYDGTMERVPDSGKVREMLSR